ncbi:sulfatase family protein [Haladaptatus sp. NG-SE-30]
MPQPNVLLICCDDLGYGDLGCYGAEYETPNIDGLAADGVQFTDWHSNGPVCSPSRASLLTGKYPHKAGVPSNVGSGRAEEDVLPGLPTNQKTLADYLGSAGYETGAFGKWHLGMADDEVPNAHGFDEFFGFLSGCVDYYSHLFMWRQGGGVPPYHDLWENRTEVWHNGEYLTHLITDRAVEFVADAAEGSDPFFGYVAYNAPHYPMHAPEEYLDRFPDLPSERRIFAAMLAAVDDGVGKLLATLEETGVAEETIVIFTSDHGPSREVRNHLNGSRELYRGGSTGGLRGEKGSLFEGGIRVPAIVRHPNVDGGRVCDELAVSMDVVPSILDACALDIPSDRDGESLLSLLQGDRDTSPHDRVYWTNREQRAVRDGDWKLVLNGYDVDSDPAAVHLSDLSSDPEEKSDLSDDHENLVAELRDDVRAWAPGT